MSKVRTMREELAKLSKDDLINHIHTLRRDLFSLRLQTATTPAKDKLQFNKMRKDIARALTYLRQLNVKEL
jgi:ribosomal protein L29